MGQMDESKVARVREEQEREQSTMIRPQATAKGIVKQEPDIDQVGETFTMEAGVATKQHQQPTTAKAATREVEDAPSPTAVPAGQATATTPASYQVAAAAASEVLDNYYPPTGASTPLFPSAAWGGPSPVLLGPPPPFHRPPSEGSDEKENTGPPVHHPGFPPHYYGNGHRPSPLNFSAPYHPPVPHLAHHHPAHFPPYVAYHNNRLPPPSSLPPPLPLLTQLSDGGRGTGSNSNSGYDGSAPSDDQNNIANEGKDPKTPVDTDADNSHKKAPHNLYLHHPRPFPPPPPPPYYYGYYYPPYGPPPPPIMPPAAATNTVAGENGHHDRPSSSNNGPRLPPITNEPNHGSTIDSTVINFTDAQHQSNSQPTTDNEEERQSNKNNTNNIIIISQPAGSTSTENTLGTTPKAENNSNMDNVLHYASDCDYKQPTEDDLLRMAGMASIGGIRTQETSPTLTPFNTAEKAYNSIKDEEAKPHHEYLLGVSPPNFAFGGPPHPPQFPPHHEHQHPPPPYPPYPYYYDYAHRHHSNAGYPPPPPFYESPTNANLSFHPIPDGSQNSSSDSGREVHHHHPAGPTHSSAMPYSGIIAGAHQPRATTNIGSTTNGRNRVGGVNASEIQRKNRKNSQSRTRSANLREQISIIHAKPEWERTDEEQELLKQEVVRRDRKNVQSRNRAAAKKEREDEILAKPEQERTPGEVEWLEENLSRRKRKLEGDRLRRQRIKELGLSIRGGSNNKPGISARGPLPPQYQAIMEERAPSSRDAPPNQHFV